MMPSFYQKYLERYLKPTQLITLKMLVWLLQSQKQVRIERLAATLPLPILENSRRRHIQRFLSISKLSILALWFPIIKEVISRQIKPGSQLIIALDRTQWKENNVFMVSAIQQKRAFPIFWMLLDKKGACNFAEQKEILRPVIWLLRKYKLVIIGDREFQSIELALRVASSASRFCISAKMHYNFSPRKTAISAFKHYPD